MGTTAGRGAWLLLAALLIAGCGVKERRYEITETRIVPGGERSPFVFRFELRDQQKYSLRVLLERQEEDSPPLSTAGSSRTGG